MIPCAKSTVLFPYFAEWFVDGFLRSERPYPDPATGEVRRDPARNESNHEIDLIQIYGLNAEVTHQLRAGEHGLLLSRELGGEEYPPYLYDGDRKRFDKVTVVRAEQITDDQRRQLFAFGQRHGQPAARLRPHGSALPARAQPHRAGARTRVRLGRRAAVPDGAQHPHRDPDQDRGRGVHQPHLAVPLEAARRPDRLPQPALVPPELDVHRVQPAVPLAQPGAVPVRGRRAGGGGTGHAVQHRPGGRARAGSVPRGRVAPAGRPRRSAQLAARGMGRRARERASGAGRAAGAVQRRTAASPASRAPSASRTSRATRRYWADCASCTAASTRSSSTRACSPRTCGPTPCSRR